MILRVQTKVKVLVFLASLMYDLFNKVPIVVSNKYIKKIKPKSVAQWSKIKYPRLVSTKKENKKNNGKVSIESHAQLLTYLPTSNCKYSQIWDFS